MTTFERLITAYGRVNVSANLDRFYLDSGRWRARKIDAGVSFLERVELRLNQANAPASFFRRVGFRCKSFASERACLFLTDYCLMAGGRLNLSRGLAPLRLGALLAGFTPSIGNKALALELVFGRGQHPEMDVSPAGGVALREMPREDQLGFLSHYGAVGLVTEFLPYASAVYFNSRGHVSLAVACMAAAVISRSTLQPVRIAIAVIAIGARVPADFLAALAIFVTQLIVAIYYSIFPNLPIFLEEQIRQFRLHDPVYQAYLDRVEARHVRPAEELFQELPEEPFNERVKAKTSRLMRQLQAIEVRPEVDGHQDPRELAEVLLVANRAADSLRRFCAQQPDNAALRGGLALIRDTVELTWGVDEVGFAPPELAPAVAEAQPPMPAVAGHSSAVGR